jgi:glutaredoxin-related protein
MQQTLILLCFVDDSIEVKQALTLMTGRSTFPNVFINGESIGGGDEVSSMDQHGQLVNLLTKANVLSSSSE